MICSIKKCKKPALARGWCGKHYQRWRVHGRADYFVPKTPEERFWASVEVARGCWNWTGARAGGYGQIVINKKLEIRVPTHRFSYEIHNGPIPDGMLVCHKCDNKLCVRPDHLFLGDQAANMQDMVAKGRHPKSKKSYRYKLTEADVIYIRNCNHSCAALGKFLGVDPTSISNVRNFKTWRNVLGGSQMAQYSVLCDDGDEIPIFAKDADEAMQTATEHGYRPVSAKLCEEPEVRETK